MVDFPHVTEVLALVRNMAWTPEYALPGESRVYQALVSVGNLFLGALDPTLVPVGLRQHFQPHIAKAGVKVYQREKFPVPNEVM